MGFWVSAAMPAQPSTMAPLWSAASAWRQAASICASASRAIASSASTGMSVLCTPRQLRSKP